MTTLVEMTTPLGPIIVSLETDRAPLSAGAFLEVAQTYAGGLNFWRAVTTISGHDAGEPGLVQGGVLDASGYRAIDHEGTDQTGLTHVAGAISLARFDPGTATGAGFFVCLSDIPRLDQGDEKSDGFGYAVFGHIVVGLNVLRQIHDMPCSDEEAPLPVLQGQMLADPVPILTMAARAEIRPARYGSASGSV